MTKVLFGVALLCVLSTAQAQNSTLQIACDGNAVGASVSINGQFKGECPLDVSVKPGTLKLRATKTVSGKAEVYEETIRLGSGVVKRIEAKFGAGENAKITADSSQPALAEPTKSPSGKWESIDKAKGTGIFVEENGARYEGGYLNGKRSGKGITVLQGKYTITADYKDDNEVSGIAIYPDGSRYDGELSNHKKAGQGTFTNALGRVFEGTFSNDQIIRGKTTTKAGSKYEGEFLNWQLSGLGSHEFFDDSADSSGRYEGQYLLDKPHGVGKVKFNSGAGYEGQFVDGKYSGLGIYRENGELRYEGQFADSKRQGFGREYYGNGDVYEGEWQKNQRWGEGKIIKANGQVSNYIWKNNEKTATADKGGVSFGQLFVAAAGVAMVGSTNGVDAATKVRLAGAFVSDVTGDGNGSATAGVVTDLKSLRARQAAVQQALADQRSGKNSNAPTARATAAVGSAIVVAASEGAGCTVSGSMTMADGIPQGCANKRNNTFGWGQTSSAACDGARRSVKDEFDAGNKKQSGCYCKANAKVNSVVQPFVCWVAFDY